MSKYKTKALAHVCSVCPELMELKKGCAVLVPIPKRYEEYSENDMTPATVLLYAWQEDYDDAEEFFYVWLDDWSEEHDYSGKLDEGEFEIIGHIPHLEHWLRGILSVEYGNFERVGQQIYLYGGLGKEYFGYYDLEKDEQSEDFYKVYCEIVGI